MKKNKIKELWDSKKKEAIRAIEHYMIENGLTQKEVAERLQVTDAALGKWLLGHNGISPRNLLKIKNLCM